MPFQKGNTIGHRFQPGESGNPGGRPAARLRFEELFYKAVYDDKLRREAMEAFRKAIRAGEGWALKMYFEKALPTEPLRIAVAAEADTLTEAVMQALKEHPEARMAVAQRLLEIGQAFDRENESIQ